VKKHFRIDFMNYFPIQNLIELVHGLMDRVYSLVHGEPVEEVVSGPLDLDRVVRI
jgi:hypothetical protein